MAWRVIPCWLVVLWLGTGSRAARADGGTLRLSERQGGYRVAVFTAPTPFRAGPVDISVFIQDATTGAPLVDVRVTVRAAPRGRPDEAFHHPATTAAATNKLFRAAVFELAEPGWWEIEVVIDGARGTARVAFAVEAAGPPPRWLTLVPWVSWPALAILLFCIHQRLARRKSR